MQKMLRDTGLIPRLGRSPGGGNGYASSILAWRMNEQRNLAGYSSQGQKELDMTKATEHAHTHSKFMLNWRSRQSVFQKVVPLYLSTSYAWGFQFFHILMTFGIIYLFDYSHSSERVMVSRGSCNLHSSDDKSDQVCFHEFRYLNVSLGEMSSLSPF